MIAADHDRPRAGVGDGADPLGHHRVALLDADRRRVDVADVGDVEAIERRHLLEVAVGADQRRLRADSRGPSRAPGRYEVPPSYGHADDGDVEAAWILDMGQPHERRRVRKARRLERRARLMRHEGDCIVAVVIRVAALVILAVVACAAAARLARRRRRPSTWCATRSAPISRLIRRCPRRGRPLLPAARYAERRRRHHESSRPNCGGRSRRRRRLPPRSI